MPRVSGKYNLPPSYRATSGQTIRTEQHNPPLEDIAAALTGSLPRDGSAPMTGNLPMNNRRITGLAKGKDAGDAVRKDQVTLYSAWLSSVAALAMEENKLPYATGAGTSALANLTAFGRLMIGSADAERGREVLGLKAGALAEKATKAQAEAGTNNDAYMTALQTDNAIKAARFPAPDYVSGLVDPVGGSTITFTHGLGKMPAFFTVVAVVQNNGDGYTAGNEIMLSTGMSISSRSFSVSAGPTVIRVALQGSAMIADGNGGEVFLATGGKFKLRARAWA